MGDFGSQGSLTGGAAETSWMEAVALEGARLRGVEPLPTHHTHITGRILRLLLWLRRTLHRETSRLIYFSITVLLAQWLGLWAGTGATRVRNRLAHYSRHSMWKGASSEGVQLYPNFSLNYPECIREKVDELSSFKNHRGTDSRCIYWSEVVSWVLSDQTVPRIGGTHKQSII